jgi:diphosphomevalonate decarboxylase
VTTAAAHPNIALVKYWGKAAAAGNIPATPNVSITLSDLVTTTSVTDAEQDLVLLNGSAVSDSKISSFLELLRANFELGPLRIETDNNFPTGAGLASSASGFAALVTAINTHAELGLDSAALSTWARQGSASAARSIYAGFVSLAPPAWQAEPVADEHHWPLNTVVAVTSEMVKSVSSSIGMERSRQTSPYYDSWVSSSPDDYASAVNAIARRDFEQLSQVAELSCLKMHSVMLTSTPALAYWNPATVACMEAVRQLRGAGTGVFFTIDAGPQVKAICLPEHTQRVSDALQDVPGVKRTFTCGMGDGARVLAP